MASETRPPAVTEREVRLVASLIEQAALQDSEALGRLYLQLRTVYGPDTVQLLVLTIDLLNGELDR
jgi:hypothetical protein